MAAYIPLSLPNGTTLTAEHLRHIEQGIVGADNERVITLNASSSAQDFQYAYTIYSTESAQVSYSDGDGELCSLIGVQDIGGEPTYYFLKPSKDRHIIVKTNTDTGAVTITKNSVGVIKISLNADAGTLSAEDLLTLSKNPERVVFERDGFYYFAENLSSTTTWFYSCNVYWGANGQIIKRVVEVTTSTGAYKKSDYPYTPANTTYSLSKSGNSIILTGSDGSSTSVPDADTNTTYGAAGDALGLVKSGGDVTIADGVITVNDDSHNHVIANVDGLQDTLNAKLDKTSCEASKELALGSNGKVCLGKFGAYDTNITIEINSTTHTTYHATIVIATQNVVSNGTGGTVVCYAYDDADNNITPLISVFRPYGSASRQIEVYADLPGWSKNLVHVQCVGISDGGMTDVLTGVETIPTAIDGKIKVTPVNLLTTNFASKTELNAKADQADADQLYDMVADVNTALGKKADASAIPTNTSQLTNNSGFATETYVNNKVAGIVDSSPEALNTLNELAAALGDNPNFSTDVLNLIGQKANTTDVNNALAKKMSIVTTNGNYLNTKTYISSHPENAGGSIIPFIYNDIAHLLSRGGSCSIYTTSATSYTSVDLAKVKTLSAQTNLFDGSPSYQGDFSSILTGSETLIIDVTCHKTFYWSSTIYIDFGVINWTPSNVKILTSVAGGTYTERMSVTGLGTPALYKLFDGSSAGFNRIRFVLEKAKASLRVAQIGVINYGSSGATETLVSRAGSSMFGSLIPYNNYGANLGGLNNQWNSIYGGTIYENGTALSSKYATTTQLGNKADQSDYDQLYDTVADVNTVLGKKANADEVVKLSDNPLTLSTQSSYDCNTCYDGKVWLIAGGNNVPSGARFGALFTMPYRKASGNQSPDYAGQIFIPNGDDPTKPNSMFYRTALGSSWNSWQEVATVAQLSGYVTTETLEQVLGSYVNDIDALLGG